jgi:hypothetical protein
MLTRDVKATLVYLDSGRCEIGFLLGSFPVRGMRKSHGSRCSAAFLGTSDEVVRAAGKIFRAGALMYRKRTSLHDIARWLRES